MDEDSYTLPDVAKPEAQQWDFLRFWKEIRRRNDEKVDLGEWLRFA